MLLEHGLPRAAAAPIAGPDQQHYPVPYTDASEEDPADGGKWLGAVLFLPTGEVRALACRPNRDFYNALPPRQKHIVALELVTTLVAYETWQHHLAGVPFHLYIDNDAANRALVTGFSSRGDLARMAGAWWLHMATDGSTPWVWRVPSSVNPADWPTRPADGWTLLRRLAPDYEKDTVHVDWARLTRTVSAAELPPAAVTLGKRAAPAGA